MQSLINEPQATIQRLFEENGKQADEELLASQFKKLLEGKEDQVPQLHALHRDAPVGTLVRFRAMVQDTVGDDIYASTSVDGSHCTIYNEATTEALGDTPDYSRFRQRSLLYCTEVPAETAWAREVLYPGRDLNTAFSALSVDESSISKAHAAALEKRFVPTGPHVGALVKLVSEDDSPRPTDVIEIFGIYEQTSWSPCASLDPSEEETVPSVPCIYAIYWRPAPALPVETVSDVVATRETLLAALKSVLGGDADAAEYLLLHLISALYARRASLALGNFPLNLSLPNDDASEVERFVSSLVPAMRTLQVDIKTLNDANEPFYSPRSIDENLQTGALQLPPMTQIFVDETKMKEGQLNDKGVRNVQTLSKLIADQTLEYVFPYSQFSFQTDLPALVVSHGKTFLPVPLVVNVQYTESSSRAPGPSEQTLRQWRSLLAQLKSADLEIPESMVEHIEADFVKTRQANPGFSQDDLSLRMTTARLTAISQGKKALDQSAWQQAAELDDRRRARLTTGLKA